MKKSNVLLTPTHMTLVFDLSEVSEVTGVVCLNDISEFAKFIPAAKSKGRPKKPPAFQPSS